MGFSSSGPFGDLERVLDRVTEQLEHVEPGIRGQPRADVENTDDAFVVTVDLPGFEPSDVDIEVRENVLTVEAEHDEEQAAELEDRYVRRERRHTSVTRSISLPASVDETAATASYEHGVLRSNSRSPARTAGRESRSNNHPRTSAPRRPRRIHRQKRTGPTVSMGGL